VNSQLISVVLPAYRAVDHLRERVPAMIDALDELAVPLEIVVVVNGPMDGTDNQAVELAASQSRVRWVRAPAAGWGRAVRLGLGTARGDMLAYTNLARTPPDLLRDAVALADVSPGCVVKASRRVRDSVVRRAGSLLYNLECRALFDLSVFDVNGTPKVFPARLGLHKQLRRDDDLIDAELVAVCAARGYRVLEVAAPPLPRQSGTSTTTMKSALRMYFGALGLRHQLRRRGVIATAA
jgi:glycosyltransferase involved in cell wall biosynthesis